MCSDIEILNNKVIILKYRGPLEEPSIFIAPVLQEIYKREKYSTNVIVYEVPESTSLSLSNRIANDKQSICDILQLLIIVVPLTYKVVCLGKSLLNLNRPLMIICNLNGSSMHIMLKFGSFKLTYTNTVDKFRTVENKTLLQRLLHCYHEKLGTKLDAGESNLRIVHINAQWYTQNRNIQLK